MKWLVLFEVIIITILLIIRFIYDKYQKRKEDKSIDKVLQYINTRVQEDKNVRNRFKDCISTLKKNNK